MDLYKLDVSIASDKKNHISRWYQNEVGDV